MLAPQFMKMAVVPIDLPWLPYLIFCVLSVVAACCSMTLPDTNGKELIQSIEELENGYCKERRNIY